MINLSDLKLKDIRRTFEIELNGELEEVTIFNLIGEDRQKLKDKISELTSKGLDGAELMEEIYTSIFIECTNIVIDEQIIDVLNAPTSDMLMVMQEVYDICYEIQTEAVIEKYQLISNLKSVEYTKLMLLKTEETMLITEKCKEVERNITELKKEFQEGE